MNPVAMPPAVLESVLQLRLLRQQIIQLALQFIRQIRRTEIARKSLRLGHDLAQHCCTKKCFSFLCRSILYLPIKIGRLS